MIIDVRSLFTGGEALKVAIVMTVVATFSKWLAAWATQKIYRMQPNERSMIFGLSNAQAAATLAAVLIGHEIIMENGERLLNDDVLNGTVVMILFTCVISSLVTERSARRFALDENVQSEKEGVKNMPSQTNLLKRIIMTNETANLNVDLSEIEKIITKELPNKLEKNAPPNFPELYFEFKQEYERFKEFILFDRLIGKNVVALGGGFSSGKSSFLNSILGEELLPSDITPSTSVPAYLIHDEISFVYGINIFESKIVMQPEEVCLIAHGFGKDDTDGVEVTLGHLLQSLFVASPNQPFQHIALLDTPGYSKAEINGYSSKTDEKIAHTQLNSANFILWFVPADSGTVTNSDIEFLRSLNSDIPKLIVVNKADKLMPDDLDEVVDKIHNILQMKGIQVLDVLTDSR